MHFHVLTLFPEMVLSGLNTSILGRASEKGSIAIEAVNIRDYTQNKHNKVDDYTYGGGAGMLMQAQPVYDAWKAVEDKISSKARVIYVTPQGRVFDQQMAVDLAKEEDLIFLCGHYEGIDERVLEEIVTDYVSIGDYVLTGGELPAMVMIDAIARMVPGVLSNKESSETESFQDNLLEYPQYSRPEIWHDKKVPPVLLSGDHKKVDAWRLEQSILRTKQRRPDLYEKYDLKGRALEYLSKDKLLHMDMIEVLKGNEAAVYSLRKDGVLLQHESGLFQISAETKDAGERLLSSISEELCSNAFLCHQNFVAESIAARFGHEIKPESIFKIYTDKTTFQKPVLGDEISLSRFKKLEQKLSKASLWWAVKEG